MDQPSIYGRIFNTFRTWVAVVVDAFQVPLPQPTLRIQATATEKEGCEVVLGFSQIKRYDRWFRSSASKSVVTNAVFMHWYVDFKIEDRKTIRCEAGEEKGQLVPTMKNGSLLPPAEVTRSLGKHKLNSKDIMTAWHNKSDGGKYHVMKNNCQTWIVDFLETLDVHLPPNIRTIAQGMEDVFEQLKPNDAFWKIIEDLKNAFEGRSSNTETNVAPVWLK